MFGFLLCCVGFGFTFIGVWHRRDGFFYGIHGLIPDQTRLFDLTVKSFYCYYGSPNYFRHAYFPCIILQYPRITANACRCAQITSTHDQLDPSALPLSDSWLVCSAPDIISGRPWSNIWNFSYVCVCVCMFKLVFDHDTISQMLLFLGSHRVLHKSCRATSTV